MNKNALDDTIEMINLDDVGTDTMEISFDEMQEPNPALGADVEMVMQNTRVFSTEELDAVLQKNLETLVESNEIGETRVIASTDIEEKISKQEEEISEIEENEDIDDISDEDIEGEDIADETDEFSGEEETGDYIDSDDNDYEFDDSDDEEEIPSKETLKEESDDEEDTSDEAESADEDESDSEDDEEESEDEDIEEEEESEEEFEDEDDEEDPDDIDGGDEEFLKPKKKDKPKKSDGFVPPSVKKNTAKKNKSNKKQTNKKPSGKNVPKNDKGNKKGAQKKGSNKKGFSNFIKNLGPFEYAAFAIGLVIVGLLVALCVRLVGNNKRVDELEKFASVGFMFESMDGIGNLGIEAMSTKAQVESIAAEKEREALEAKEKEEEEEEEEIVAQATVNFSSVEKDLKIKFVDKATGKPITGVKFEVTAKGPDGKTYSWVDSDMDGIIYEEKLAPGNYEVTIVSVEPYKFPETASIVKVQDTIVYQAINIMDEVVDMKDVDLSKEESRVKDVEVGTVLSDTVAWVESSKTLVSGVDGYKEISKNDVTSPYSESQAFLSGFMKVDGTEIILGEEKEVGLPDDKKHSDAFSVEYEWTFSADVLNKVSGGETGDTFIKVSVKDGVAENTNASVSCTIKYIQNEGEGEPVQDNFTGALTVKAPAPILPDGVTINDGPSELTVGGATITLTASVTPENASDKAVTWSSSNEAVAKVDASTGVVTAVAPGTADIKVSLVSNPAITKAKTITVKAAPVPITLSVKNASGELSESSTVKMIVGTTHQVTVTASESAGGYTFTTDSNAVTVSESGVISAQTNGSVKITVQSKNTDASGNKVSKSFNVRVYKDSNLTSGGKEVYVKSGDNSYRIATAKDYETNDKFYIKTPAEYKYTGWNTVDGKVMYFDSNGKAVTGEQIIQGAKYNFASDGALTMGGGSRGIDVSYYQGTIDWNAVKNSGISFVIIRCGFRGYGTGKLVMDDKYVSYIKGASAAGLRVGLYIFSQAVNEVEAVEEASFCVSMAQGYSISYPIFIDSEISGGRGSGRADNLSKDQRTAVCKAFCETIRSSGYTPGVYASKSWFRTKLNYDQLSGYKIWLAHYCTATDYDKRYDLWQHSSTGSVNGIKGNVDLDISYLGY